MGAEARRGGNVGAQPMAGVCVAVCLAAFPGFFFKDSSPQRSHDGIYSRDLAWTELGSQMCLQRLEE